MLQDHMQLSPQLQGMSFFSFQCKYCRGTLFKNYQFLPFYKVEDNFIKLSSFSIDPPTFILCK
jgi:hypothetical protein